MANSISHRRNFLKVATLGGLSLGSLIHADAAESVEYATQKVSRHSSPTDLKITDMRFCEIAKAPMRCPVIRIDTNQGISGWGEVRDGASYRYALFLKSRILGMNPCNVEMIFKRIRQFAFHGRQGGGVSGVEMALWDLAGKAYDVPVYQLLGGRYREKVRLYCDTTRSNDPVTYAKRMKERVDKGFTFLKMDFGIGMLKDTPGAVVNSNFWDIGRQWSSTPMSYGATEHPFTRVQITPKGLEKLTEYVEAVRNTVGYEIPLAADHFGHFGVNDCIRLGKAMEPYQLAWLEDMIPWKYTDMWREITTSIDVPTLTGEDIFGKEEFIKLCDARAVDMIQPDLASAGGILETKKIGDYAEEKGIPMAMHFAGTPISFMANVHCAAATQNFVALEHHSVDIPWWEDLVTGIDKPLVQDGFVKVPDGPGLGVELNEEVAKAHLTADSPFFTPTSEWDKLRSWDRLWS
ncbi:MAG: mandelate racemase/muconate lactonizing enzyme family protein [Bacteroidota bacterium]